MNFSLTFAVRYTEQHRGMEQLAARWAHNPKVTGSSPVPATKKVAEIQRLFIFYTQIVFPYNFTGLPVLEDCTAASKISTTI